MKGIYIKRFVFYLTTSFAIAFLGYYLLSAIGVHTFGVLIRMYMYHYEHPTAYILIPCFLYSIFATLFADRFLSKKVLGQILLTILIIVLVILFSSPFGGMLWHFHDMQAGHFPDNWFWVMLRLGFSWGLECGWFIVLLSFPYNLLGMVVCFFLTKEGTVLFSKE